MKRWIMIASIAVHTACGGTPSDKPLLESPSPEESSCSACDEAMRECLEDGGRCGDCSSGFVDAGGTCVPETDPCDSCDARSRTCGSDGCGGCLDGFVEEDGECVVAPIGCESNETAHVDTKECVRCSPCSAPGSTGRLWPVTDRNGSCVCETMDGYYFDTSPGARIPVRCDADGDGWVKRSAINYIDATDDAVRVNARCALRWIDRFVLKNELGQEIDVPVAELEAGPSPLALYETDDSDEPTGGIEQRYGSVVLGPSDLNPLTKLCTSRTADFNDNRIADLGEWERIAPAETRAWMMPFTRMSHFAELHRTAFVPGDRRGAPGRVVIAERRRCDPDFPLAYGADAGSYWRSCVRRRRSDFERSNTLGADFARYACSEDEGSCNVEPLVGTAGSGAHGVCNQTEVPAGPFRGMNHHSQFACVELVADGDASARTELEVSALRGIGGAPGYDLQACDATGGTVDSIRCQADTATVGSELMGRVAFVAARFGAYGPEKTRTEYERGCVDEGTEWPELCPGYDPALDNVVQFGLDTNFGLLVCGCDYNYSGASCEIGCPSERLHIGGDCEDDPSGYCRAAPSPDGFGGGRRGIWMCGRQRASMAVATSSAACAPGTCGAGFVQRSRVATAPRERRVLFAGSGATCSVATPCADPQERCRLGRCRRIGGFSLR